MSVVDIDRDVCIIVPSYLSVFFLCRKVEVIGAKNSWHSFAFNLYQLLILLFLLATPHHPISAQDTAKTDVQG